MELVVNRATRTEGTPKKNGLRQLKRMLVVNLTETMPLTKLSKEKVSCQPKNREKNSVLTLLYLHRGSAFWQNSFKIVQAASLVEKDYKMFAKRIKISAQSNKSHNYLTDTV